MGKLVLKFLKMKHRKRIRRLRKQNPELTEIQALAKILRVSVNGLKSKVMKISIIMLIAIVLLFVGIVSLVVSFFSYINTLTNISSQTALEIMDNEEEERLQNGEWNWDDIYGQERTETVIGSGGVYPKDPVLRSRAELLEIVAEGVKAGEELHGTFVEPAWMIGSIYRENGNRLYSIIDNSNLSSLFSDLLIQVPACGKGGSCKYTKAGISHYHGGTVVNGVDKGDPYTQIINTDKSIYDRMGGDHAIGVLQFEIPYLYGRITRIYGDTAVIITDAKNAQSQVRMDEELGFIRPNPSYVPDIVYNASIIFASKPSNRRDENKSNYDNIIQSADFKSISEYNQNFIKFVYASSAYGRGHINSSDDKMAQALIKLAKSGKIEKLDEMVSDKLELYWDGTNIQTKGNWKTFIEDVNARYGMGLETTYYHSASGSNIMMPYWYGVYAANVGKVAVTQMQKLIASAKKEGTPTGGTVGATNGNWVGRPGTGVFGSSGSEYYIPDVGIRWYHQTSTNNKYSKTWGNLKMGGYTSIRTPYSVGSGKYQATLASGGCGIYTIAMLASNLLDADITPDMALASLGGKHTSFALHDSGVPVLVANLGLKSKKVSYTNGDIYKVVEEEIAKGNMILFVSKGGPHPWYSGNGHFMAIRGITEDGKYLGITSVGNAGKSAAEVMKIPIEKETWKKSLSGNRNYVWVVGLNVD